MRCEGRAPPREPLPARARKGGGVVGLWGDPTSTESSRKVWAGFASPCAPWRGGRVEGSCAGKLGGERGGHRGRGIVEESAELAEEWE